MDGLTEQNCKDKTLQQIATKIINDRGTDKEVKLGKWGGFSIEEHYKTLADIANGEYKNLSNLVFKAAANDVGRTDFVAYAFEDKHNKENTAFAFRGSMGSETDAGALTKAAGFTGKAWIDDYYTVLLGYSTHFPLAEKFVEENKGGGEMFVTGHSKGGITAARIAALFPKTTGIGVDCPGIGQLLTAEQRERLNKSGFISK
jgi:hypothetical protein